MELDYSAHASTSTHHRSQKRKVSPVQSSSDEATKLKRVKTTKKAKAKSAEVVKDKKVKKDKKKDRS